MLRASAASTTEQRSTPWINWCGPDPIEDGGARAMTHPDALPVAAEVAVGARRGIPAGALPTKFKDRVPVPSVVRAGCRRGAASPANPHASRPNPAALGIAPHRRLGVRGDTAGTDDRGLARRACADRM